MLVFRSKNTVERIFEKCTILHTVYSDILAAIMHPEIHDAGISLAAPHFLGNGTTTFSMFDPKITDTLVRISQRKITALRMRERSGIKIQFYTILGCPLHPAFEMFHLYLIAIYEGTAKVTVNLMQIQTVLTGDIRSSFQNIGTQFFHITGFTGIVSCSLDTTGQ